jgi:hypothetical protein
MDIGGVWCQLQFTFQWHACRNLLLAVCGDIHIANELGFLQCLGSPGAGIDIVSRLALPQQVHRNHSELNACSALDKENGIVIG